MQRKPHHGNIDAVVSVAHSSLYNIFIWSPAFLLRISPLSAAGRGDSKSPFAMWCFWAEINEKLELEPHGQDESGYEDREVNWGLRNKFVCDSGCQLILINNKFELGLFQKMCHSGWSFIKDMVMSALWVLGDGYTNHCGREQTVLPRMTSGINSLQYQSTLEGGKVFSCPDVTMGRLHSVHKS